MSVVQKTKIFFPNLDGLRFIAFFLVFSEHVLWGVLKMLHIQQPLPLHILYTLFCNGGMGVSIFFVLSGFLITYLILSEVKLTGKINVGNFYIRRFLRIWPLYYVLLIFAFYIYPIVQSHFGIIPEPLGVRPAFYFTFLSNFDLIHIAQNHLPGSILTGPTWSVAVEEQFYLLWPLLFLIIPKKFYGYVFLFIIVISYVFRLFYYNDPDVLYFHSLSVCGDLAMGGLSAYLALNSSVFCSWFEDLSFWKRVAIYLSGIAFILLHGFIINNNYTAFYDRILAGLFFAWVIMDQNYNRTERLKLSRFKYISLWGKYTYGMYLLHEVASLIVMNVSHRYHLYEKSFGAGVVKVFIVFFITCLISYCSYHWFEKYFLKLKERFAYFTKE